MIKNVISKISPENKALGVTIFFIIIEIGELYFARINIVHALPTIIFYTLLIFNTYFSIKLFARLIPVEDTTQHLVDILLFSTYVLMVLNIGNSATFVFFAVLIFIFATTKYSLLLGLIKHPKLLKKKILVDLSGVLACLLAFYGIIYWNEQYSLWILTFLFAGVNALIFSVLPLYVSDSL